MTALPSASHWNLLSICQLPAALPWTERVGDDDTERGNDRHRFLQRVGGGMPREQALAMVPAASRTQCEAMDLPRLSVELSAYRVEVSFALDPDTLTVTYLGAEMTREQRADFAARDGCGGQILGTLDRYGATDSAAVVRDFKGAHAHLPGVREDWQLRIYRLMATRALGSFQAICAVDRIRDDGSHYLAGPETFTYADLLDDAAQLQALVAKVRAAQAEPASATPVEGPHCTTCPARLACPAKVARMGALMRDVGSNPKALTRDDLTKIALALPAAKAWLEEVEHEIKVAARWQPFTSPDGRVFGPKAEDDFEHADPEKVQAALDERYDEEDVGLAVREELVVTAESVDALARKVAPERALGKTKKALREYLRQAGALPQRDVYRWRKPETGAPATTPPAAESAPRPALIEHQGGAASLSEVEP